MDEDDVKPDGSTDDPTDLPASSWWGVAKRTFRELKDDNLTDWAAALTYYGTLSLFPALIVLVALIGVFGTYPKTTNALLDIVRDVAPSSAVDTFRDPVEGVVRHKGGAGALLGIGLLASIWSASAYIGAFMRACNVIYEVKEGRRFWKLRPLQIFMTLVMVSATALVAVAIVITGPLASAVGDAVGLGETGVTVWNIVKWPILLVVVITMIAFLYYASPNVKQPPFRWITPGGIIAIVVWLIASLGFGLYAANFGSYNSTYGSLGGVVIFLIWLWITNLAILFGAEFNSELERSRELAEGKPAHDQLQLPPREAPKAD